MQVKKLLICLLIPLSFANGQTSKEDSLLNVLEHSPEDTGRVTILTNLILETYLESPSKALEYSKQMTEFSKKINFKAGIGFGYSYEAYFETMLGDLHKALDYYFKAVPIFQELDSITDEAIIYNNIAELYADLGEDELALNYHFKSLAIKVELKDSGRIANTIVNIGIIYFKQHKVKRALQCYIKGLEIYKNIGHKEGVANCLRHIAAVFSTEDHFEDALAFYTWSYQVISKSNDLYVMGNILMRIGDVYEHQGEDIKALQYYKKATSIYEKLETPAELGTALGHMGYIYYKQKKWDLCLQVYNKALDLIEKTSNKESIAYINQKLGEYYFTQGDTKKALNHTETSYRIYSELAYPGGIKKSAEILYQLYKLTGSFEKSLEVHEVFVEMKDSIEHDEGRKALNIQKEQFEEYKKQMDIEQGLKDAKEKEEARIERRNVIQYSLILLAIFLVFAMIFLSGFIKVSPGFTRGLIFVSLLFLFEFILVLTDPFVDGVTRGIPIYKLLVNSALALSIFPIHAYFERRLRKKLNKPKGL